MSDDSAMARPARRVVIVAPYFPPSNLAGVHRARLFATHLPKFGWRVQVLSVAPEYYEEPLDRELEQLLPPSLEIVRTRALPTRPLRLVGDIGVRAFWWHYRALGRLIRREKIDLVYIPIPPNYSAVLGPLAYRRYGVPYAIDYIDPWNHPWPGSEVRFSKAWCALQLGKVLEPIVLRQVRLVTAVAPGYWEGALRRSPWLDPSCCLALPYGAEETDFRFLEDHPRLPTLFDPSDGNRHIVYAGAMLPRAYSTLEAVLQALRTALDQDYHRASRMRVHFIGTGSRPGDPSSHTVKPWVERAGLAHLVREHPMRIPYLDVLNHLMRAHAVLVLGSSEPHYTASKVFQAILSRRPVIGILHVRSTAAAILREANAGHVVTFDESQPAAARVGDITRAFIEVLRNDQQAPRQLDWRKFKAYTAEAMTEKLAAAFDAVLEGRRCPQQ